VTGSERAKTVHALDRAATVTGSERAKTVHALDRVATVTSSERAKTVHTLDRAATVTSSERAKTVHALDRAATVTSDKIMILESNYLQKHLFKLHITAKKHNMAVSATKMDTMIDFFRY
jgi:hypothetical protein